MLKYSVMLLMLKWNGELDKHLPRYLAEFCYRFNRRFVFENMLPRLCYVAVRTPPMPMRLLKLAEVYGYQDDY